LLSDEDGLTRIFALLRERTRVDFTHYKPSTVVRRIERRMTMNQLHDLRDYVRFMESYASEVVALYRELLIGVTSFFRDREVFDELEINHLPRLFERAETPEIRFWVAGCSTGEEAYTLAMLSREVLERLEKRIEVKIFATDLDRDAILRASGGRLSREHRRRPAAGLLTKYFHLQGRPLSGGSLHPRNGGVRAAQSDQGPAVHQNRAGQLPQPADLPAAGLAAQGDWS
jgi:two-component system CheB/CheR fusion protein